MLSPLIRRPRKNESKDANSKQRGVTLALVAASLVALIAMAALSIDDFGCHRRSDERLGFMADDLRGRWHRHSRR
jgi:hypothetical protein